MEVIDVLDNTVVVIGCSTTEDYAFLLPLTCLLWRDVIGYKPHAFLVGDLADWRTTKRSRLVVGLLKGCEIQHSYIGRAEGYPDHTLAQNCRQHAAASGRIEPDTWVMPADADLWPLRREFYHQHENTAYLAVCYYSNGDHFNDKWEVRTRAAQGLGTQTIPTCHVAMRARDWRTIYDLKRGDVAGSVKRSLDAWLPSRTGRDAGMSLWMSDQQLMTEALCQQLWFPQRALMVERRGHPPVDRLDRSHAPWPKQFDPSQWVDAHVHRRPWINEHWGDLEQIVATLLPHLAAHIRAYRDEYVREP